MQVVLPEPRLEGAEDDHATGQGHQTSFHAGADELHLAMSVGMIAVLGSGGDDEAIQRESARHHVHDALQRIAEDGVAVREMPCQELDAHEHRSGQEHRSLQSDVTA